MGSHCIKSPVSEPPTRDQVLVSNKRIRQIFKKLRKRRAKSVSDLYCLKQPADLPRFSIKEGRLHDHTIIPGFLPRN